MSEQHKTFILNMSFVDFLNSLATSEDVRNWFINSIISTGFKYCFLEFPVLTKESAEKNVEFTVVKSGKFPDASWEHFANKLTRDIQSKKTVTYFNNISNDTILVVPVPVPAVPVNSSKDDLDQSDKYSGHLMDFLKRGKKEQQHALIILMARQTLEAMKTTSRIYLSTHGHGVPWLHIRICNTPKYYSYEPYKQ